MKSAFFFERTTAPSWSSRCSRKTSTSSPSFRLLGSLNSSIGTAPSDLNPTSRMTAVSVTRSTFDLTISPSSMLESVPSYSSVIFAISSGEYSSCRSARTRSWEWGGAAGAAGASGFSFSVSTNIQYTGSVVSLGIGPRACARGLVSRRNLAGETLPRQRHDAVHLLREGQLGRIEQHGVCGGLEGRHAPGRVGPIPIGQGLGLPAQLGRARLVPPLRQPATGPLLRPRRQEHLERGVRKHHR